MVDDLLADVDQVGDGDVPLDAIALAEQPALLAPVRCSTASRRALDGIVPGVDRRRRRARRFLSMIDDLFAELGPPGWPPSAPPGRCR